MIMITIIYFVVGHSVHVESYGIILYYVAE